MSLRSLTTTVPKLFRQQAMRKSTTAAPPKSEIPNQYRNRSETTEVSKSFFNVKDPRTYPRYIVALTIVGVFAVGSVNSYQYNRHHMDTEVKNDPHAGTRAERPSQMARDLSQGPIAMNAKRYDTLQHYGLGVDKDHKTAKQHSAEEKAEEDRKA